MGKLTLTQCKQRCVAVFPLCNFFAHNSEDLNSDSASTSEFHALGDDDHGVITCALYHIHNDVADAGENQSDGSESGSGYMD